MRFSVRYGFAGEYVEEFHDPWDAFNFAAQLAVLRDLGWIEPVVEEVVVGEPFFGTVSEHG